MIQILIVDDEKPICDLIQMSLTRAGYRCTCVYDGLAAADILEHNVFDLILLDVMLPNADGFELMEYIRPLGIPVIFLTARGSVDDRVRGLRMGAEDYIVKPFEVLELLARVDVVLRRYNKTDAVIEIGGLRIDTRAMQVWRGAARRRSRSRTRNMTCCCFSPATPAPRSTARRSTSTSGAASTATAARPWICTSSGCAKRSAGKTGCWP